MPVCFVSGCSNTTSVRRKKENPGVRFHSFPKNFDQEWLKAIGKPINTNCLNKFICSDHFPINDYEQYGVRRKLKLGAIPSLNLDWMEATASRAESSSSTSGCELPFIEQSIDKENIPPSDYLRPETSFRTPELLTNMKKRKAASDISSSSKSSTRTVKRKKTAKESSSSTTSSVKRRIVKSFHSYCKSPPLVMSGQSQTQKRRADYFKQRMRYALRTSYNRRIRIQNLKSLIKDLQWKYELSSCSANSLESSLYEVPLALVRRIIKTKKRGKITRQQFPPELRNFAMTLQFYSSKAYNYVRETFDMALPAPSTISSWLAKVDCSPGYSQPSLDTLKLYADSYRQKNTKQLLCALLLDEIKIKSEIICDRYSGEIWGYVDIGTGSNISISNENECATEALVLMVVAVNDHFKLPIGYFFVNKLTGMEKANIIREALRQMDNIDFKILSVTCDGPSVNFRMMKELGCEIDREPNDYKTDFLHPTNGERIYVIFDICHILKLVRNNWANSKVFIDPNGKELRWDFIEKLYMLQEQEGLHLGNKLKKRHMEWRNYVMKVNIAAQTLSSSVASALEFLDKELKFEEFKDVQATVDFIKLIDQLFDLLNSRNIFGKGMNTPLKQANMSYWKPFTERAFQYLQNCRDTHGKPLYKTLKRVPFAGFMVSLKSITDIFENEVLNKANLNYLLT